MSSKAIKHTSNETLLVFADFYAVNAHVIIHKPGKRSSGIVD